MSLNLPKQFPHSHLRRVDLIALFLLFSLHAVLSQSPTLNSAASSEYNPGRILIQPKAGVDMAVIDNFHRSLNCTVSRVFQTPTQVEVVELPTGGEVKAYVEKYLRSGLVEFAEPDYLRHLDTTPNDPKYLDGTLWGLNNYGQNGGTPHADIDAPEAWDVRTSASNVVVAILDSGVRYTHEDLAANMWTSTLDGSHGTNAVAGTTDPNDDNGHGTLMAGVLGAVGNNSKGVVGVAWAVQMMACKCFNSSGAATDSEILACMDYAQANGARIISASFDSPSFGSALSNAIYSARSAGMIFVASAGNNSTNIDVIPHYPACYGIDNIVSVGYTTRNDQLGGFSNYGATNVDLAAPGDQIYSTWPASDSSYYPPAFLQINLAGTSFAAAYVSGACALLVAKYPSDPYPLIIQRLLAGTDPVPSLAGKCVTGGRLNLRKALSPPIRLQLLSSEAGSTDLRVSAGPNRTIVIQTSPDLISWTAIATNATGPTGTLDFVDNSARSNPCFYRASSAP